MDKNGWVGLPTPTRNCAEASGQSCPDASVHYNKEKIPMKYLKMLGLAVIAAAAVTAFLGAGSASATVLCTENTEPCNTEHPAGKMYKPGDLIHGVATDPLLTASPEITCASSTVTLEVSTTGSAATSPTGKITELTFSTCKVNSGIFSGTPCTVTSIRKPYSATATLGTKPNGTLTVVSGGSGSPGAKIICGGFLECTFSNTDFSLPITGGAANVAAVTAKEVPLTIEGGGFGCPASAKWDAVYKATTPVFVEKE
jgi:hypothetical protein